jgi:hypothetical protein
VIGRRAFGHKARRKPVAPLPRQRTRAGQATRTALPRTHRPACPVTRTPAAHDATRPTGHRTRARAANTVRAANTTESLSRAHQERSVIARRRYSSKSRFSRSR